MYRPGRTLVPHLTEEDIDEVLASLPTGTLRERVRVQCDLIIDHGLDTDDDLLIANDDAYVTMQSLLLLPVGPACVRNPMARIPACACPVHMQWPTHNQHAPKGSNELNQFAQPAPSGNHPCTTNERACLCCTRFSLR
jgi:hypothetical protein